MSSSSVFAKIFRLVKENKEKVILFDYSSDQAFVLIPLEEYEKLKSLTDHNETDKINQEIAFSLVEQKQKEASQVAPSSEEEKQLTQEDLDDFVDFDNNGYYWESLE